MNVGSPILSVIPSLDGPVLAALAGSTAPLALTEAHRRAGHGSLSGVRNVLVRLVSTGLVLDVPGGFVLNREHVAADAIIQLSGLHGVLAERIRAEIDASGCEVILAGLYGSVARRDGDEQSDVDLLVVSNDEGIDDLLDVLQTKIARWTGNPAHVVALDTADLRRLRRAKEPILAIWQLELQVVHGDRAALRRYR